MTSRLPATPLVASSSAAAAASDRVATSPVASSSAASAASDVTSPVASSSAAAAASDSVATRQQRGVVGEHQRRHRVVAAAVHCRLVAGDGWRSDASCRISITQMTVEARKEILMWYNLLMVASILLAFRKSVSARDWSWHIRLKYPPPRPVYRRNLC